MRKRLVFLPTLAVLALALAVPSAAAAPWRTLIRTSGPIWNLSLDPSGRAAWIQYRNDVSGNSCFRIRQAALMRGQDVAVTPCIGTLSGHVALKTVMAGGAQRIVWAYGAFGGNSHTGWTLWATTLGGPVTRLASMGLSCSGGLDHACLPPGGTELGPMAARDGVLLYSMDTVSVDPSCTGYCTGSVTGGQIRSVGFAAAGHAHLATVPGAPPAAMMTTGGGILAEQPYTLNTERGSPQIQLRSVSTGTLLATIPITGRLETMAMSASQLAVMRWDNGFHLVRYDAHTGARLGSLPLHHGVDPNTLGIYGNRILFQTTKAIRIYRTDLGRVVTIARQDSFPSEYRINLTIDCYGVRWTTNLYPAPGGEIRGINFR